MPSACTKPEKKASTEAETPAKQCINIFEKKVRNLEKRKGKLDAYREKAASGQELNDDQKEAVSRYDFVVRDLELTHEYLKQFLAVQGEVEKTTKKQLKRESHERQQAEIRRFKELLGLQNLLDSLGADDVRADFISGAKGAVKLTEEELDSLDELYKLISPSREEGSKYAEQLTSASEHIVSFLDAREKDVAGTTYKALSATVNKITECGYFDRKATEQPAEESPAAPEPAAVEEQASKESEQEAVVAATAAEPTTEATTDYSSLQQQLPTETPQQPAATPTPAANMDYSDAMLGQASQQQQSAAATAARIEEDNTAPAPPEDTFFSTQPFPQPRPFNEIVSSVQANFTFLQDSELEQAKSNQQQQQQAAMDPAVMAQMGGAAPAVAQQPPAAEFSFLSDTSAAAAASQYQTAQELSDGQSAAGGLQFSSSDLQQPSSAASSSTQPPVSAFADDPNSMYGGSSGSGAQSLMGQGLQNNGSQQYDSSQGGASFGADSAADSGPPQPIPMPAQYNDPADQSSASAAAAHDRNANRQFAMNPNADIFQSMYAGDPQQQTGGGYANQQQSGAGAAAAAASAPGVDGRQQQQQTQQAWGSSSAADFQSQGYGGQYGGRRGNQQAGSASAPGAYRGNQQPRNAAGGGPNNMNNGGYRGNSNPRSAPGNQRGGNPRGGAGYNGAPNRGMQQQQQQGAVRGPTGGSSGSGGAYKGYPARNDYQPEGGYQGYNASSTGFMQPSQGGPRSGPRNSVPRSSRNNGNYGNRMPPQ